VHRSVVVEPVEMLRVHAPVFRPGAISGGAHVNTS
jgi:hypothetical protein